MDKIKGHILNQPGELQQGGQRMPTSNYSLRTISKPAANKLEGKGKTKGMERMTFRKPNKRYMTQVNTSQLTRLVKAPD